MIKNSEMRTRIVSTIVFTFIAVMNAAAQPLPPSTPYGNPVPFSQIGAVLLIAGAILLIIKKKKQSKYFRK